MIPALQKVEAGSFVIEISADFDAISDEWRRLEADGQLTPFQTRAWLAPLSDPAPQLKAKPVFVLVREKATGRPAMLLPLCARRHFGVTVFEFADLGVSDFNAPILAPFSIPRAISGASCGAPSPRPSAACRCCLRKAPRLIGGRRNPMTWDNERMATMTVSTWGVIFRLRSPTTTTPFCEGVLSGSWPKKAVASPGWDPLKASSRNHGKKGSWPSTSWRGKDRRAATTWVDPISWRGRPTGNSIGPSP